MKNYLKEPGILSMGYDNMGCIKTMNDPVVLTAREMEVLKSSSDIIFFDDSLTFI